MEFANSSHGPECYVFRYLAHLVLVVPNWKHMWQLQYGWLAVGLNGNADRDQQEVELLQMSLMCIKLIAVAIENFGQCVVSQANNHCGMLVTAAASNHLSYLYWQWGMGGRGTWQGDKMKHEWAVKLNLSSFSTPYPTGRTQLTGIHFSSIIMQATIHVCNGAWVSAILYSMLRYCTIWLRSLKIVSSVVSLYKVSVLCPYFSKSFEGV